MEADWDIDGINESSKWPTPTDGMAAFYNDGKDTICILKANGRTYLGYAECGKRDTFNEELGMAIALGRACKKYHVRNNRQQARNGNGRQNNSHFEVLPYP